MRQKKKTKTNPEPSAKQGKREGSRGGEASSSKSKGAATKSGRKSKDDTKVDGKLKDNTSKSGAKSKDNSRKRSGKSVVDASKTTGKSKGVDASTPKSSIKFKLDSPKAATKDTRKTTTKDTPKTVTKSKGKASKSGNKSNANGSGKAKAGSAKVKETKGKEKSTETVKTPKSAKGKSLDTLKGQVQNFLSRALVADELLRHPDVDVKVAVASCISEITRITAPDAPYEIRYVFRLIVSSFENLSDKSSRSYSKRTLILKTVAKVRSCVVMLDLECDGLIVEMFHHFLKAIRDYHPENVFSSMVTIMSLVLEESEDILFELISPVLASVKRDNQEVLPIAQKLGERVFKNCAIKGKPY
ncbi:unnamed protein product [Camellia sinensis]